MVPLRFETCLIDPGDDATTYLELRLRDLKLRNQFNALLGRPAHRGHQRSGKEHTMTVTVCFPVDQVVQFDAMATVETTVWWCRICGREGTARTAPQATSDAIAHLGIDHGGVRDCAPRSPETAGQGRPAECKRTP